MRRLPLFVLPTVLYPGGRVPLHVFEPRYRRMVARCLEYDRRFGLLFHRNDVYGPFEIEPGRVGCVASILEFHPLPDGRSLLIVEGEHRFRVVDGLESETPYAEAVVEPYRDEDESDLDLSGQRKRSLRLLGQILGGLEGGGTGSFEIDPREEASFALASRIEIDPVWHQELLELRRESSRLERIEEILRVVRGRPGTPRSRN